MATDNNKRKIVWIFGAGASRGAGAVTSVQHGGKILIPMQSDFWETILRFTTAYDRKIIQTFLFKYFKGYKKTPPTVQQKNRKKYFRDVGVEEVFTFLSERISQETISPQLKAYYKAKVWESLIKSVSSTFRRFKSNTSTLSVYRNFAKNHLKLRDAIISFNYDTVFENSLRKKPWFYYGLKNGTSSIPIFKPHGSINWSKKSDEKIKIDETASKPIIVAPTHLKFIGLKDSSESTTSGFLDSHRSIDKIWKAMEKQMEGARVIAFIGYSFPDADLYFSSVLRTVLAKSKVQINIVLVNPDSLRIADKITNRFAIKRENIQNYFDLKSFSKHHRNELI